MIDKDMLEKALCQAFCTSATVNPVPCGYAVGTPFLDDSGDVIECYIVEDGDGYHLEDDGGYLSRLKGSGVPIDTGSRRKLLEEILAQSHAFLDADTYEIRSRSFPSEEVGSRLIRFVSSLIRVRDLECLTPEIVRSTFREDATADLREHYGAVATFHENEPVDSEFLEFLSDLVIRPIADSGTVTGAIYFVASNERLNEALLLFYEAKTKRREDFKIIALIEDAQMPSVSRRHFQRAQNRSLPMPIYRGDEKEAVDRVGRELAMAA